MNDFKKKGLGMGISALLENNNFSILRQDKSDSNNSKKDINTILEIELDKIMANQNQPRKRFDDNTINELAQSIKQNGLIQPILVKQTENNDQYMIVAGERRYRASQLLGLKTIRAIVLSINDIDLLKHAIIENVQREDLSPIEEANGYRNIIDNFGYTHDMLAQEIGKSRSHITNILRILNLPHDVQLALENKEISFGHAKVLLSTENAIELKDQIIKNNWSVRDLEDNLHNKNTPKNDEDDDTPNAEDLTYAMIKQIYSPIIKNHINNNDSHGKSTAVDKKDKNIAQDTAINQLTDSEISEINNNISFIEKHISEHTGLDIKLFIDKDTGSGQIAIKYNNSNELSDIIRKFFIEF